MVRFGASSRCPWPVIGGLTLSFLLTLIVIPVAYATLDSLRERFRST